VFADKQNNSAENNTVVATVDSNNGYTDR